MSSKWQLGISKLNNHKQNLIKVMLFALIFRWILSKIDAYKFAISKFVPGEKPKYISGLEKQGKIAKMGIII